MANPTILYVPGLNPIMTPTTSGTQYILGSTPFVSAPGHSTSATYSAPFNAQYNTVSMGPFNQLYGWHPLYSYNPQVEVPGGIVPNMHIPAESTIVPPPFSSLHGQSLIGMNPPYVSQGPMVSYVASKNP